MSDVRPIIAIDVDDVLAMQAEAFVKFSNKRWGTNLTVDDYAEHWGEVWKIDHQNLNKRVKEIYESGEIIKYKPHNNSDEILKKLADNYQLIILTSRWQIADKETRAWLDYHYGDIFEGIYYSGFFDRKDKFDIDKEMKKSKGNLRSYLNFDYLIDDQLKHCVDAAKFGYEAVLFGDYKWNQMHPLPANVTRCKNWQEVAKFFGV